MATSKTQKDLQTFVGKTGQFTVDGLTVQVKVADARVRFGHIDLLLTPVAGSGARWIQSNRVKLRSSRSASSARRATAR